MRFFLNIILLLLTYTSMAQSSIDFHFVKANDVLEDQRNSHFNSLKITNPTAEPIMVQPQIILPKGWQLAPFMPLENEIIIPAHDSVFIALKILIPKYAKGGQTYSYRMELFDANHKFIGDTKAILQISEVSKWEVEVLEQELYLPSDSSRISFKTRVTNKGNKTEHISLYYRIQDKTASKRVDLEPGVDSVFTLTGEYSNYESDKSANREYVDITASNGLDIQDKTLYFVKFKNDYNGLRSTRRPNSIGFVYDNFPSQDISTLSFQAIGSIAFKDQSELSYFLMNTDLGNTNQYSRSTVYRLQYLSEELDLGLGSTFDYGYQLHRINTVGGRRQTVNGNNAVSMAWRPYQNTVHQTTIFVSRNVLQPITTVIAGHRVRFGRSSVESAFTYNLDLFGKRSLKIGTFQGKFPIGEKHYLGISGNIVEETQHLLSLGDNMVDTLYKDPNQVVRNKSLNYRAYYNAYLFDGLNISVSNAYSSPYYPNGERGLFNFDAQLSYQSKNRRIIRLGYRLQNKAPYTYQYGIPLAVFGYHRENTYLEYNMPIGTYMTLFAGTLLESHQTQRLSNITTDFATFTSNDFKVFMGSQGQFGSNRFQFNCLYGYAIVWDFMDANGNHIMNIPKIPTFDIRGEYSNRLFRIGANYVVGPTGTVTQYSPNADDLFGRNLRLYVAWQHYFLRKTLRASLSGSSYYQFESTRGNFAITPRIEFFKNNWRIDANTVLNYYAIQQNDVWKTQWSPRVQVGLYRDFYIASDEKYYNLEIVCFKDDNGNGQMEAHELGLADVQVEIIPIQTKKKKKTTYPVKLFSNHKGKLFFKKISEGQYQIEANAIHNNAAGYIIKESGTQIIDLKQDMIVYIPFAKANTVKGQLIFDKNKFSNTNIQLSNIRVTATSNTGEIFHTLTDKNGGYSLALPESKYYTISIQNPFDTKVYIEKTAYDINFEKNKEVIVDFNFFEKKKAVNFD